MRSLGLVVSYLLLGAAFASAADDSAQQLFENKIRPLLIDQCYTCHSTSAKKLKGNLYLDSQDGLLKGGDSGPAVVPRQPQQSKLIEAISWSNVDLQMPPKHKLSDTQIADLSLWVKMGAPWPDAPAHKTAGAAKVFDLQQRKASHWCWQPILRPAPPAVRNAAWTHSPIDAFVLAKLEAKGLDPAPPATRPTLIRRAYFDLIGLPPSPRDIEEFVADPSPDAFAKVVDRLLASEHFGERWARHWMDLVRYGETRGHEFDGLIPNAYQYRDYLIRAFNSDVPYNQFVTEHIAGDLLPNPRTGAADSNESILGTGFWFLGEELHSPVDIRQDEADRINNRVDTMTKAVLGLTVGCARCHDHKFDAITQKDFYALNGFLISSSYRQVPFKSMRQNAEIARRLAEVRSAAAPKLLSLLVAAERPVLASTGNYLDSAMEIVRGGGEHAADVGGIATRHSLSPQLLRLWAHELTVAKGAPSHPLHLFASIANDPGAQKPEEFKAALARLVSNDRAQLAKAAAPVQQVILDFDAPHADWYSDGVAFGLRPVRAGEVVLGEDAGRPLLGISHYSAARQDPAFNDLSATPGTETDYGTLGEWPRSGQTIRTPKMTLKSGHLWYLVRGAGRAYAAVDSHLMIAGPLHGGLLRQWGAEKGNRWTWIHQDLSAYAGQRCEVEFSPVGSRGRNRIPAGAGNEFPAMEVARVIEADQPTPLDLPGVAMTNAAGEGAIESAASLGAAVQKILLDTAARLSAGTIAGSSDARELAPLADLLVSRSDLFIAADGEKLFPSETARTFADAQAQLEKQVIRQSPTAPAMWEGNGVDENLLIRGVAKTPGEAVPRRFLEAIAGANQKEYSTGGSGRLQLANALLARENPLTSRVIVNRVWQHLFGRGIVPTVDNFGFLGQPPTHPELLDYLADRFRSDEGWSTKKLIRSIMLSSAYQMSSKAAPAAEQADPQNLLLHHMPVRRLEAEPIRDAILAVSGRLDEKVGGPPVEIHVTQFMEGRGRPGSGPLDGAGRRSIYIRIRRNFLSPMMLAFDMPQPFACVGRRNVSNVPAQALILMNDPMVYGQAGIWAKRVLDAPNQTPRQRITGMYLQSLGRQPTEQEVTDATNFLDQQGESYGLPVPARMTDVRPWTDLCHVMFNLKEFIFIE